MRDAKYALVRPAGSKASVPPRIVTRFATLIAVGWLLASCAWKPAADLSLDGMLIVTSSKTEVWSQSRISDVVETISERLASCRIDLPTPQVTRGPDAPLSWIDDNDVQSILTAANEIDGWRPNAVVVLVNDITASETSLTVLGRAYRETTPGIAVIAADHERQTPAHEIGHLLGLHHAPGSRPNLMSVGGCHFCDFTPQQCDTMRASPRLTPIGGS